MSLNHSPSVVTDGLVLYYDMNNIQKSWKGAPATNLTPDLGILAIQAGPTVTYVGLEDGWKKYSLNGTWTAGTYPYSIGIDSISFTGGVTYSSGVYIKTNVPTKFASLFTGMNYTNQPLNNAGNSFSIAQSDGSIYVGRSGFQYTSTTTQNGYLVSQPVVGQVFTGATDFVYIKNGQVETGSFPTPFVAGTRSNTQAIVDLTGTNTVTATSLTYAANNTFTFNGTSDSITVPFNATSFTFNNEQTIIIWMKNQSPSTARRNPYNQAYGGGGTITHESDTYFNYYYGTAGTNGTPYTNHGSSFSVVVGETAMICLTRNVTQTAWYKNGVLGNTQSNPYGATVVTGTANITIGNGYSVYFGGSIYAVQLYNRALSAAEVSQNFNALRGRYGL
jgi:hypothetical protein